jgi:hypothetical protein
MDKVKAQAEQALVKGKQAAGKGVEMGKQGVAQGQAKVKDMQAKKAEDTPGEATEPAKPTEPVGDYKLDDL